MEDKKRTVLILVFLVLLFGLGIAIGFFTTFYFQGSKEEKPEVSSTLLEKISEDMLRTHLEPLVSYFVGRSMDQFSPQDQLNYLVYVFQTRGKLTFTKSEADMITQTIFHTTIPLEVGTYTDQPQLGTYTISLVQDQYQISNLNGLGPIGHHVFDHVTFTEEEITVFYQYYEGTSQEVSGITSVVLRYQDQSFYIEEIVFEP